MGLVAFRFPINLSLIHSARLLFGPCNRHSSGYWFKESGRIYSDGCSDFLEQGVAVFFYLTLVGQPCDVRVNWDLSEEGDPRLFGCLRRLASPEDLRLLATVWAYYVAHILNQAQNLHRVQLFTQGLGHVDRLRNYHQRQILRRRDDDHSLQGKRLKYSQWGVRGSRREICQEEV